jgi:hypothetical protein
MLATVNPTFDMCVEPAARDLVDNNTDVETAAAALRVDEDLFRDEPQTVERVEAMEKMMIAVTDAKMVTLRAEFAELRAELTQAAPGADAIAVFVAHLSQAPTNWHQSAVHFAALPPEDQDAGWSVTTLLGGIVIVMAQCVVAVGLFSGTLHPSCESNDQCAQKGVYCDVGGNDRCGFCGFRSPLPTQTDPETGGTLNNPHAEDFTGYNTTLVAEVCGDPTDYIAEYWLPARVASWCESCVSSKSTWRSRFDPLTPDSLTATNVAAMGKFDWVALLLAAFIVALTVVGELKDIELVTLAIRYAGDKLSPRWRFALALLGGVRRWVFLPALVIVVPVLVMYKAGDALSVCFNTVAVLFLCEIDNITYAVLLSERVRSRAEASGMRVEIGDAEAVALARTKVVHVALITVVIPVGVWTANISRENFAVPLAFLAFGLAGAAEAVGDAVSSGGGAASACKGVVKVAGALLLGLVGWGGLEIVSWAL